MGATPFPFLEGNRGSYLIQAYPEIENKCLLFPAGSGTPDKGVKGEKKRGIFTPFVLTETGEGMEAITALGPGSSGSSAPEAQSRPGF